MFNRKTEKEKPYCCNCKYFTDMYVWNAEKGGYDLVETCTHPSNVVSKVVRDDYYCRDVKDTFSKEPKELNKNNDCVNFKRR